MLIAITGGNGFLGSYLSNYLLKKNFKVRRIQRKNDKSCFVIKHINENTDWTKALKDVEVIVHCAAKVHIFNNSKEKINSIYSFNVNTTKILAKQAAKLGVKKFIFISTVKVFGEETNFDEKFSLGSPLMPVDHYSKSKLEAEIALKKITSNTPMELIIIRPPLIYGPKVGANFLKIMNLIKSGFPMPFGSIKNRRSIIYLGNLVDFIGTCIRVKKLKSQVYLPTDLKPLSTPELIIKIGNSLNKKPLLIRIPKFLLLILSSLIFRRKIVGKLINSLNIDSSQSYKDLNWYPPYTTDEGLYETAKWFLRKKK